MSGALLLGLLAGYGTFLLYTACVLRWRGLRPLPSLPRVRQQAALRTWLQEAGLGDVPPRRVAGLLLGLGAVGAAACAVVFGPGPSSALVGLLTAGLPLGALRTRRLDRRAAAADAWPRLIEEIRVLTTSSGRSVPHALFEAGRRAPGGLRPAFDAAHREWLLSTDLERSLRVLRTDLADPTADAVCETLLVAHHLGGVQLDERLRALADDRIADLEGRKDARARQAGARFARRFVLLVPGGMALAGLGIGDGRAAYGTGEGQLAVAVAAAVVAACWWWAGRIMALPPERRVLLP